MSNSSLTSENKRKKLSFYSPLTAELSSLGEVTVTASSEGAFWLETQKTDQSQDSSAKKLNFSFSKGEILSFEGSLVFSSQGGELSFEFDPKKFSEPYSKLLIKLRKNQHIDICQREDVEASDRFTGFSRLSFLPSALPELDERELDVSCSLLGRKFSFPFFITGMTGGVEEGERINFNLAQAAVKFNIPMGLGSQRMALEHPEYARIFVLKDRFPELFLFGNVGFSDLIKEKDPISYVKKACDMVGADAFAIHLNVLQECVQAEGNRDFKGSLRVLEKICSEVSTPIIVKEVGSGVTPELALELERIGVKVLDVGGKGGTSWSQVEAFRSPQEQRRVGMTFRNWGAPTAFTLASVKKVCTSMEVTATGGIRNGLTVAKSVALGASSCGLGLPLFKAALKSSEAVEQELSLFEKELKITLLSTGSKRLVDLNKKLRVGHPLEKEFYDFLHERGVSS